MNEESLSPLKDLPPDAPVTAPATTQHDVVPWLYGLGFLVLAVAIIYLWQYPGTPAEAPPDPAIEQRLADLDSRLTKVEQQSSPALAKISARLNVLEGRTTDETQLASRLDALSGRIESLSGRDQTGIDAIKQQMSALTAQVAALESNAGNMEAITKRLNRLARLQEASAALAAGRPIGDLPDAPPVLVRYAHIAPPTEADLRLRFPAAVRVALQASQPIEGSAPFLARIWDRAQNLITIRRGDEIVVGNPSAVILARAQTAVEAGDLSQAVDDIETLKGKPAQVMASWLSDAKALLDARSALIRLTAQS